MKKFLLLGASLCLMVSVAFCKAPAKEYNGINFETSSFAKVLEKAKAEDKLVFVDVYASWCPPCQRMASDVFPQKVVGDYFNATFVNAKFDAEKGEGVSIARRYSVNSYPTFLILDGDGALVGKMLGGSPADDFIRRIKALVEKGTKK